MSDNLSNLTIKQIEELFANGSCLTFSWKYNRDVFQKIGSVEQKAKNEIYIIASKKAVLNTKNSHFHYFDNGVLLCSEWANIKEIEAYKKLLKANKYKINQVFYGMNKLDYVHIDEFAQTRYKISDAYKKICPSTEKDLKKLFANGNICLSACKNVAINPRWRKQFALFSDGQFFECFDVNLDPENKVKFMDENKDYVFLAEQYISPEFMEKIYKKSEEFDWYSSPDEARQLYDKNCSKYSLSEQEKQYISDLIKDNPCLSIDGGKCKIEKGNKGFIIVNYCSPDTYKYVLFADGRLIATQRSESNSREVEEIILQNILMKLYPEMKFCIEWQEPYMIEAIYKILLKVQNSAKDIYCSMLKEMARKLKHKLNISHIEALELVAKIKSHKNWHEVTLIDEAQARYCIKKLKVEKYKAKNYGVDWTIYLYLSFMIMNTNSREEYFAKLRSYGFEIKEYNAHIDKVYINDKRYINLLAKEGELAQSV